MFDAYLVTCKKNGMKYVGVTTIGVEKRWKTHCSASATNSQRPFGLAIKEFGKDNFIIDHIASSKCAMSLSDLEKILVAQYNCMWPSGYNLSAGGYQKRLLSDATRKRMCVAAKKRYDALPDEEKKRRLRGVDPSSRSAVNAKMTGKKRTPEQIENIRASWTPERRKKNGELSASRKRSEVERRACAEAKKIARRSKLTKEQISEKRKAATRKVWESLTIEERNRRAKAIKSGRIAAGGGVYRSSYKITDEHRAIVKAASKAASANMARKAASQTAHQPELPF